ncbi:MAG: ribokinase [Candidatus Latescibacteria bacterium]|nr:ribokinase [Candidatus Latescibacterota bacterium]
MNNNIVVIGSSNTDMIIKMDHIPKPGETILGGEFSTAPGGKGANQAVAAARAGGKVTFIARVGNDMFGERALSGFRQDNINIDHVIKDNSAPSGVALIFVDRKGENSIAVASGANAKVSPEDVRNARDSITKAGIILMQLEIPVETVETAAQVASASGVVVILNPAPAQPLSDELLRNVTILTPNESEAELLTGIKVEDEQGAKDAAETLIAKGIKTVIITLGARGVYLKSDEFTGIIPAFKVDNIVDTTAAGDVFNGVLAVSLAESKPLAEAIRFAHAAAALSVTKLGAQTSAPHRADIDSFLRISNN